MFTQAVYQNNFSERPDGESVTFCYAHRNHIGGDYEPIEFPSWEQISTSLDYTTSESPFAADTEESERARWRPLVPDEVLKRPPRAQNPVLVLQVPPGAGHHHPILVLQVAPGADQNHVVVLQRHPGADQDPVLFLQRRPGADPDPNHVVVLRGRPDADPNPENHFMAWLDIV